MNNDLNRGRHQLYELNDKHTGAVHHHHVRVRHRNKYRLGHLFLPDKDLLTVNNNLIIYLNKSNV